MTVKIVTGQHELLEEIRPLWQALNDHHKEKSDHFKEKYDDFDYDMRLNSFMKKVNLYVVLLKHIDLTVGYVIASGVDDIGEIESLYIDPDFRGGGHGELLMTKALNWLEYNSKTIRLGVAQGNEDTFSFYEKFGFYPKVSILERKKV